VSKSLNTLIRLSKWNVDEKRRVLVALQTREDEIIETIRQAEAQLVHEQRVAAADSTGVGFLYGAYAGAWLNRREQMLTMLESVRAEIVTAHDDLALAFNELKTYEITQRERDRRAKEEADKKEQALMDEIGLNLFRRKEKPDEEGG
jgi:flagellar export protein FliJ